MQQLQKFDTRILLDLKCYLLWCLEFVFCGVCLSPHTPSMYGALCWTILFPMSAFTNRLIGRWSCSMMLFKYFFCRNSVVYSSVSSPFNVSIAFEYAAFLSTVMTRGDWVWSAFKTWRKNRSAALPSRFVLSIKSSVLPALSTVRVQILPHSLNLDIRSIHPPWIIRGVADSDEYICPASSAYLSTHRLSAILFG